MELSELSAVLTAPGPFVTVHVPAESDVEQAAAKYDLEWKGVLQQLESRGVDESVREALSAARGQHAEGPSRLVVATVPDATVRLAVPVSSPPPQGEVRLGALPDLSPLLEDVTSTVPHVVVLADRTGADVTASYDAHTVAHEATVKGSTLHLRKVPTGGWAHLHYQHRAENQWAQNADQIVATTVQLCEQVGAELILGVGDSRELTLVRDALPQKWQPRWTELPGGRSEDGSEQLVQQRIADALARHVAAGTLELLEQFSQERGQDKRACEGVEDVVAALRKAQVQTLLVNTGLDRSATLWFGTDPTMLGTRRQDVTALGDDDPAEGPLLAVLLRAAVGTGADVQLVPAEPEQAPRGGVGAVLRYADDSK